MLHTDLVEMASTSVSLLQRIKQPSSQTAWERFVELYAPLIFHWGVGQGLPPTDAADLVQDVMAILIVKLPQFEYDPNQRFRGWLRTITVNRVRDLHRRRNARPEAASEPTRFAESPAPTDDLFEETEYRSYIVNRALELMRSEFREDTWQACWRLVVDGEKAADVAADLGVSVNTVYLAKSRVLKRLREELAGLVEG